MVRALIFVLAFGCAARASAQQWADAIRNKRQPMFTELVSLPLV